MIRSIYEDIALLDTSAVIALHDPKEPFHKAAKAFYSNQSSVIWAALDITSHECYTRVRYGQSFRSAFEHYSFLRNGASIRFLRFVPEDEQMAESLLTKYSEHCLSFHDALCAAVMKRVGMYKVFTFDADFQILGFLTLPGQTAK